MACRSFENLERCENISTDWNCSSGINQHSVCIKQCSEDFHSESIKCKCKHNLCRWEQKGKPCTWARRVEGPGPVRWDRPSSQETPKGQQGSQTYTEQSLMNSIIDSVHGQSVFGENFSSNFDIEPRIMQPEVINYTPGGPRAQRGMPNDQGDTQFSQNPDENSLTQLLRDIKLSNTGHMVFNVNYFNNYASNNL